MLTYPFPGPFHTKLFWFQKPRVILKPNKLHKPGMFLFQRSPFATTISPFLLGVELELKARSKNELTHRKNIYFGLSPLPLTVTTRIITFLVGNPINLHFHYYWAGGQPNLYCIALYGARPEKRSDC